MKTTVSPGFRDPADHPATIVLRHAGMQAGQASGREPLARPVPIGLAAFANAKTSGGEGKTQGNGL